MVGLWGSEREAQGDCSQGAHLLFEEEYKHSSPPHKPIITKNI